MNDEKGLLKSDKYRFDFLKHSIDYNNQIIQFMDAKSQLILIAIGIIIPLASIQLLGPAVENSNILIIIVSTSAILLLTLSFLFSILVIIARDPESQITTFFGLDVLKNPREKYKKEILVIDKSGIISDYCDQVYTLGLIMKYKFKYFKYLLYCLLAGLILTVLSFIVISLS